MPVSVHKRFLVMQRDGFTCRLCRQAGGKLEVDHIIPVCKGGSSKLENLQTLCKPCNRGKGGTCSNRCNVSTPRTPAISSKPESKAAIHSMP